MGQTSVMRHEGSYQPEQLFAAIRVAERTSPAARATASAEEIEPEDRVDEDAEERLEALQHREAEPRDMLDAAEVVGKRVSRDTVAIGSIVTVEDQDGRHRYTIVGSVGANAERAWITIESPLGSDLLGRRRCCS